MKRSLIVLLAGSALVLAACTDSPVETLAEPLSFPSPDDATLGQGQDGVEQVVRQVLPAVVNVVSEDDGGDRAGEGTGFIVREDGIIVTNFHVVEGGQGGSVTVFTSDEEPHEYDARVIGGDVQADLAILDIDAEDLPTVPLGDSDSLNLGQQVVAIGYALGLEGGPSVTSGIVSSLARRITVRDPGCPPSECGGDQERVYTDVIQTDAAINFGNSGGPLVDLAGNVVGINTAGTSQAENVGFAIQVNSVKLTIFGAAENPDAPVAFMGIGTVDATDPNVQFELDPAVDEGAAIVNVVPGGPADRGGVELGDVVVSFDGEAIANADELGEAIRSHRPGATVEVVVVRGNGERVTLTVELGDNPVPVG
ncbi:MAG: trypsin-like peptidase domain-containing protein [Actinomycetota bacterium]